MKLLDYLKQKGEGGFSLLELVVGVGVVLVLTVGGVLGYNGITDQARQAAVDKAASEAFTAAQAYRLDNQASTVAKDVEGEWNGTKKGDSMNLVVDDTATCLRVTATHEKGQEAVRQEGSDCGGTGSENGGNTENPGGNDACSVDCVGIGAAFAGSLNFSNTGGIAASEQLSKDYDVEVRIVDGGGSVLATQSETLTMVWDDYVPDTGWGDSYGGSTNEGIMYDLTTNLDDVERDVAEAYRFTLEVYVNGELMGTMDAPAPTHTDIYGNDTFISQRYGSIDIYGEADTDVVSVTMN